ncbi:MAG: hypothetical protein M3220_09005, partial [Chloroflexota bacterium]|nr:hypothetical protein [Chloroflexota bacterium]
MTEPRQPAQHSPYLALALELLRRSFAQPSAARGESPTMPIVPPLPPATKRLSATDLLTGWFQPTASVTHSWDDYFGQPSMAQDAAPAASNPTDGVDLSALLQLLAGQEVPTPPAYSPVGVAAPYAPGAPQSPADSPYLWIDLWDFMDQSAADVADDEAEAAVTCLYDFVHALGRRDVEAAMECVAPHYHVFENEQETDRLGLRHQMESMLDSLRDWELEASLLEVPHPVAHSNG